MILEEAVHGLTRHVADKEELLVGRVRPSDEDLFELCCGNAEHAFWSRNLCILLLLLSGSDRMRTVKKLLLGLWPDPTNLAWKTDSPSAG